MYLYFLLHFWKLYLLCNLFLETSVKVLGYNVRFLDGKFRAEIMPASDPNILKITLNAESIMFIFHIQVKN